MRSLKTISIYILKVALAVTASLVIFPPFDGHESKDLIGGKLWLENTKNTMITSEL
jgi:hypothetical protein